MKCNLALCQRGTIDAILIPRGLQEDYHAKGKNCVCLVNLEKAFDGVRNIVLE